MAARQHKTKNILTTVVIIFLLVLAVGLFAKLTDGFTAITPFAVKTGEQSISDDTSGMKISPNTTFSLKSWSNKDYTVTVTAAEAKQDFTFTSEGKTYSWNKDMAGKDLSTAFTVTKDKKSFTLSFDTVEKTLEKALGKPVTISDTDIAQDLFIMNVSQGKNSLNIAFAAVVPTSISLPDQIIFS